MSWPVFGVGESLQGLPNVWRHNAGELSNLLTRFLAEAEKFILVS